MEHALVQEEENQRFPVELGIKEEIHDSPDFVDINLYATNPIDQKPGKSFVFHHCSSCSNKYRKADYLQIHQAVHGSQRFCPICSTTFTDKRKFTTHINQHIKTQMKEDKEKECICSFCQKNFATRKRLKLHVRTHTGERPYKCEICGQFFKLSGALKDHQVTHTKKKEFVCEICKGEYTTRSSLNRHMKRSHKVQKSFNCEQCDIKFSNKRHFNCHQKQMHSMTETVKLGVVDFKRECQNCDLVFDSSYKFEVHRKKCLKKTEYECILCGDVLFNLSVYSEHKREHMHYTKDEYADKIAKVYPCKFCSKTFSSLQKVFRHLYVHMEKTDQCNICYDYYSKYGLKKHMIRCHKALQCKICLKFESGKNKLYRHYRKYHAQVVKKFGCQFCRRQYMTKKALYIHHRIVHDTFFSRTELSNQMTAGHVMNNEYYCQLCNVSFRNREVMMKHKVQHFQIKINKSSCRPQFVEKSEVPKNFWVVKKNIPIKCPKCVKTLKTVDTYRLHNKLCGNKVKIQQHKLKCKICFRILCNKLLHKEHLEWHFNMASKCKHCNLNFETFLDLRKHRRSCHSNRRMNWCKLCNCDFKKFNELARHMLNHVLKENY